VAVSRDALQDQEATRVGPVTPACVERMGDDTIDVFLDDDRVLKGHTRCSFGERDRGRVSGKVEGDARRAQRRWIAAEEGIRRVAVETRDPRARSRRLGTTIEEVVEAEHRIGDVDPAVIVDVGDVWTIRTAAVKEEVVEKGDHVSDVDAAVVICIAAQESGVALVLPLREITQ